jgi:hypothetical protein
VKGHHTNNIEPVEAQLCCYVCCGDEEEFQPFIYQHDVDEEKREYYLMSYSL